MSKHFQYPFNPIEWPAVPHDFTGDNNLGIYTAETTQRYMYGTRYITWDGRVYKYAAVTTNGVHSYDACAGTLSAQTEWVAGVAADAGQRFMTVTDTTEVAEDLLAGGMVHIYNATIANGVNMFIVGNEAGNATNIKVYLEYPLPAAVTVSDSIEMYENQYRAVDGALAAHATHPWMGVACVTAATGYNVWIQTWGVTLTGTGNTTLDDAALDERTAYFKADGSISEVDGAGVTAAKNQMAGYIYNAGTDGIAGPQIYLMCST